MRWLKLLWPKKTRGCAWRRMRRSGFPLRICGLSGGTTTPLRQASVVWRTSLLHSHTDTCVAVWRCEVARPFQLRSYAPR
jgi:hypothetical protein